MKIRERCWLWGHPEGRYNTEYGNDKVSRMTPMECCAYLGIHNCFMVPNEWEVNTRQYNKSFRPLREVGWSYAMHKKCDEGKFDEIFADAAEFKNISCVAMDDFASEGKYKTYPLDKLRGMMDRLHNNPVRRLDSWMVLYTFQFGRDSEEDAILQTYVDEFDGIIMWTWKERDVHLIPEKFEIFKKMTPHHRRLFGCYLYNFGEKKQATAAAVKEQLDFYYEKLKSGEAEGIVFHTNTMADLDYEAYDVALAWLDEHGDEEVPDID